MNWIRTLVSGDKIRVKDGNINLDLSYITDRIIGKKKKEMKEYSLTLFFATLQSNVLPCRRSGRNVEK